MGLVARLVAWLRRRPPEPVYDEREAYAHSYGERYAEIVVSPKPPPSPRVLPKLAGDYLRRCFEERLESRLGHRVERAGETEPLGEGGVGPEDEGLGGGVDEDPLEILRREAVIAAGRSRGDDPVEALDVPEPLEGVGRGSAGLDAGVDR
jgi:hypothetical protein